MSFKPYTEKIKKKKIGIRIRNTEINDQTRLYIYIQ